MYCWEGLLVIQHFWRSDFFKRCWISSSISQTISKNAQKKKWWLFFTVYVLIMCFVWLFQIMVLTCSDVTWIFPIAWQNGQKGKKNDHKHIAVPSTLCNTPYRRFFFSTVNFEVRKFQARPLGLFLSKYVSYPNTNHSHFDSHYIQGNQNRVMWVFIIKKTNLLLYLIIRPLLNCILKRSFFL